MIKVNKKANINCKSEHGQLYSQRHLYSVELLGSNFGEVKVSLWYVFHQETRFLYCIRTDRFLVCLVYVEVEELELDLQKTTCRKLLQHKNPKAPPTAFD